MILDSFREAARGSSQWFTHCGPHTGAGLAVFGAQAPLLLLPSWCSVALHHTSLSRKLPSRRSGLEEHPRWQNRKSLSSCPLRSGKLQLSSEQWLVKGLGECVISSVLSHRSKNLKWLTSVTAWLQLSFIGKTKDSTPLSCEGRLPPKERPQSILASSFYVFVSSPPWAYPMHIGLAKKGVCLFHLSFSLCSVHFLLFCFCRLFPFFVF